MNQRAVAISPSDAELHNNLSVTLRELGKLGDAETRCKKSLSIKPDYAEAHNNLGITLKELGNLEDAEASCRIAIGIKPRLAEAHNNLGIILQELGKLKEADQSFREAIAIKPEFAQAYTNLANNLQELGLLEDAKTSYLKAIAIEPHFVKAHTNLGNVLRELDRLEEAITSYRKAISLKPDLAEAHSNLGNTLKDLGKLDEAEASYRKAIEIKPGLAQAHSNLGMLLHRKGRWQEAVNSHRESVALEPNSVALRWCLTMSQLSNVYETADAAEKALLQFETELNNLDQFIVEERLKGAEKAVGKMQPYFIAYLDNNNKKLLTQYGDICHRVMKYWQKENNIFRTEEQKSKENKTKIKIGIISSHIRYHSVWNAFLKGIVTQINKDQFSLYIYYLDTKRDEETQIAEKNSFKFISGKKSLLDWSQLILQDDLDIGFFPEIGMHDKTLQLASMRLAKSQCTSWGHPETSGLPTIDYYISSELTEDSSSPENYSETLICLKNLGCYFDPPSLETGDMSLLIENGVDLSSNILLCLGPPNKFHPNHDNIYIEVLRNISNCQFIFMRDDSGAYKVIQERLVLKLKENGISPEGKIIFLPYLSRQGFNTLMSVGRVLIDNKYFSHFNTTMQALGCNLPVVTMQGRFMRSRATAGILKRIHMDELVVATPEIYINIIIKLINDEKYYESVKSRIKSNVDLLYRDSVAIRSLETSFENIVKSI
jgi:predicted O-linked N-acetylglucosamine transferase (SPINDLY family)